MATLRSFFNTFIYLVLILFHLGCFIFKTNDPPSPSTKKRKVVNPLSASCTPPSRLKPHKPFSSSSWSYVKRIFSFNNRKKENNIHHHTTATLASARSSQQSILSVVTPADTFLSTPSRKRRTGSISELDFSLEQPSFPLRNDIFPCPTCGEIFHKTPHLEQHQSIKHAVSELFDGDSGKNIVRIIFKTGWSDDRDREKKNPTIHRILKIHNSPKILARFEEYRESVKSIAAKIGDRRRDERCIADGNELLRFHCSTLICNLGQNGNSSICSQQYCSVCGIIRSGFSAKMDGISTLSSSWRAHVALPEELEEEFAFMNVKRAMLVCRVISGRIGSDQGVIDKDDAMFDSVVGRDNTSGGGGGGGTHNTLEEDELLVFNPRALLPCFVIVYSVSV